MSNEDYNALGAAMWQDEARVRLKALKMARDLIVGLAGQQAMDDDSYKPGLRTIEKILRIGGYTL